MLLLILLAYIFGVALTAFPAQVEWEAINTTGFPPGPPHSVAALVVGPGSEGLYAGTNDGVYRSDDGGTSWRAVNQGLTALDVRALAVGPGSEGLYAGTNDGVYRSDDGGTSWRAVSQDLPDLAVQVLAVGQAGEGLYAGTSGGGVYRSDDGGTSWQVVNQGLTALDVRALAVGPGDGGLYAGTAGGVYRSDDGGASWRVVNQGLTVLGVQALAVGPGGEGLYAGTSGGGMYRSDDGGASWRTVNQGLTVLDVRALAVGPGGEGLYAGTDGGVYRSDDGGASWQTVTPRLTALDVRALAVGPGDEGLYAGSWGGGVCRSNDGGASWQAVNQGLTSLSVWALAVGPGGEGLYAGTWGGGVCRSSDGGASWQAVNQGLMNLYVSALAVGPGGKGLYAGTDGGGVFRSDDGGASWQAVNQGLMSLYVRVLAVGPGGEGLYAGTWGGGVYRSDDGGASWRAVNQGLTALYIRALAVGPGGEGLYVGTWSGGMYRSDDGGASWQAVNQGLTALDVRALAVGPGDEGLYAGTDGGVYRSDDGGASWRVVNQGLTVLGVQALAVGPGGEGLYAGTSGGGMYRSDDGGASWRTVNPRSTALYVGTLVVGTGGEGLYAGTFLGGVYRSDDGGSSWRAVNQGLTSLNIEALMVGMGGEGLYALTWPETPSASIFRSDDGGETWQVFPDITTADFPYTSVWGTWQMESSGGRLSLTRPGMDRLPWATHQYQAPETFAVQGNIAKLYASAGAGMILRAEVPLPVIWHLPTPCLAMVAATWRGIYWAGDNAGPLSAGLGLALVFFAAYVYIGIARPNRLSPYTVLWLLPRPRHLLAASGYQGYAQRWALGDPLERLALLQAAPRRTFSTGQLAADLEQAGAVSDDAALNVALNALAQRGFLLQEDGVWRIGEPALAQVHLRELPPDTSARLATQVRQQHPLYARARGFFTQANFHIAELGADAFLCTPQGQAHPQAGYGALYARLITGRAPTGDDFTAVCEAARVHNGDDLAHRVALIISDRRPEPGARYRLYEIRQREGLAIAPLDVALFGQIKPDRTANDILAAEIDQATGQQDLYAIPGPVSGDLSFFGRERVLQEIIDLLDAGQPVGLLGLRKMGKTSLIQRLQGRLAQRRPLALVDTQKTAQQQGIWSLYPDIIAAFAGHLQRTRPDVPLPALRLWPDAPAPTPALADAFTQDVQVLHAALGAPEKGGRLLLIVDEIDRLLPAGASPGYAGFAMLFGQLRALNQHAQLLDFLVVGVDAAVNRVERWTEHDNELYRALREVWMPPMAPADVREMIESLGFQMGVRYEEDALHWLAECGGGQPFVTRQMCSRAVAERLGRGAIRVTLEQARQAVEEFIFGDPYLPELWRTRLDDVQREMLRALARAAEPLPRLAMLPAAQRQVALASLIALEDYTLVRREDGQYTLAWDVFRRWIRWIELGLEA